MVGADTTKFCAHCIISLKFKFKASRRHFLLTSWHICWNLCKESLVELPTPSHVSVCCSYIMVYTYLTDSSHILWREEKFGKAGSFKRFGNGQLFQPCISFYYCYILLYYCKACVMALIFIMTTKSLATWKVTNLVGAWVQQNISSLLQLPKMGRWRLWIQ